MFRKFAALSTAIVACAVVAACGGGGMGHSSGSGMMPMTAGHTVPLGDDMVMMVNLPKNTVGEELPDEGVGTSNHKPWGKVGGFTQTKMAQTLAFPPGTTITVRNLSKSVPHTFNVVKEVTGPPAKFPKNVNLSIPAKGGNVLALGYASGEIQPGHSVKIKLTKPGIFLIGCAFHYSEGMQDVIVIKAGAKPGPQGQPTPTPTNAPTPPPGGGGW
jgi:plastocyanin